MATPLYSALVVDDEVVVQKLVAAALTKEGFGCDFATDGVEALERVTAKHFDAVVTDLRMPNRNGHALAVDLLGLAERPVIIIHTGVIEPRLANDLLSRGVDDIVFKPISFSVLATKVKTLVERRPERPAAATPPPGRVAELTTATPGSPAAPGQSARGNEHLTVTEADMQRRLSNVASVLPIPHAALEVYRLATNEDCENAEFVAAIEKDASLAAELLRIANSPAYNPTLQRTSDLHQIVMRIGRRRVGEVAVATHALAGLTAKALPWMDVPLTSRRSMAARTAMELLIEEGGHHYLESGLLLTASLHSLGRVVLGTLFPWHYERMLSACQAESGTLRDQERRAFNKGHTEALALVLADWHVPSDVHFPLRYLLDGYEAIAALSGPARIRAELLKLAVLIGRVVAGPWMPWDTVELPPPSVFERLRLNSIPELIARTRETLHAAAEPGRSASSTTSTSAAVAQRLRYASLFPETHDVLAPLLAATGITLEPCLVEDIRKQSGAVLINGLGAGPQMLQEALSSPGLQGQVIVCEPAKVRDFAPLGRTLELPTSYERFQAVCREVSTLT